MIKYILNRLMKEELGAIETNAYNNLQIFRRDVNEVLGQSFGAIKVEIEQLKVDIQALKTTQHDNLLGLAEVLTEIEQNLKVVANDVDFLFGEDA